MAARHLFHYGYKPTIYYPKRSKNELYQVCVQLCFCYEHILLWRKWRAWTRPWHNRAPTPVVLCPGVARDPGANVEISGWQSNLKI